MKLRTRTETFLSVEHNGDAIEFEVQEVAPDGIDGTVYTADDTVNGVPCIRVGYLVHDDDAYDLWEWEGNAGDPSGWVNGSFRDFRGRPDGPNELVDHYNEMARLVGEDHVFLVEVYSHGLESYSRVSSNKFYPDREWDVCASCVLAVPPDVTNPEEWADGVLESYTAWGNGDVWGVVQHYVKPDGTVLGSDACWGYIGSEYASDACKEGF